MITEQKQSKTDKRSVSASADSSSKEGLRQSVNGAQRKPALLQKAARPNYRYRLL
jgi:hypothetical protein